MRVPPKIPARPRAHPAVAGDVGGKARGGRRVHHAQLDWTADGAPCSVGARSVREPSAFLGVSVGRTAPWSALVTLALALATPSNAFGEPLSVRGQGGFEARATRDEGALVLQGALRDDVGDALGREAISLRIETGATTGAADVDLSLADAKSCGLGALTVSGRGLTVQTDPGGRFCVRVTLPKERFVAKLAWKGAGFLDAAELSLPFDLGRRPLYLALEPKPRVVSLDRTPARFSMLAENQENGTTQAASGIGVSLLLAGDEKTALATATTDARGRATFDVDTKRFGAPRASELVLAFGGDSDTSPARQSFPIEVHARVRLATRGFDGDGGFDPEEGIPLDVEVDTVAGPVPEGAVEARVGDRVVGAANVEAGHAHLLATFGGGGKRAELRLRYLPRSPYFEPSPETLVEIPLRGPSPLSRAPLLLAGAAVVAWLVLGRRRAAPARENRAEKESTGVPTERPSVEVVRAASSESRTTYEGRVEDAHDGVGLPNVRVWVSRRSFQAEETRISVVTDDAGRFTFELRERASEDTLSAEGPFHARLTTRLPAAGELRIALVTRKRKLLERLVAWARRMGSPYDARPEPTPGHVRRAAKDGQVAGWAAAVERAAFGGGDVDERVELEVDALAPEHEGARPLAGGPQNPDRRGEAPRAPKLG